MKPNRTGIVSATALFLFAAASAAAQGRTSTDESSQQIMVLQGVVTNVSWTAPIVHVYMSAQDGAGQSQQWVIAGDSPDVMTHDGFGGQTLRLGDAVIACGIPATTSTNRQPGEFILNGGGIALVDGKTLFFGPAEDKCRSAAGQQATTGPVATTNVAKAQPISPLVTPVQSFVSSPVQPFVNGPVQPFVNAPVQPFVNAPVQAFVSAPVTAFGVPPVVGRGARPADPATTQTIVVQGVVRSVDWTTSVVHINVDGQAANGQSGRWVVAAESEQAMQRQGLTKEKLKSGESIVVCGLRAASSTALLNGGAAAVDAGGISFPDGRTTYFGRAAEVCRGARGSQQPAASTTSNQRVNASVGAQGASTATPR
jgi:hypothetical protein